MSLRDEKGRISNTSTRGEPVGEGLAPPENRLRDDGRGKPLPYIFPVSDASAFDLP